MGNFRRLVEIIENRLDPNLGEPNAASLFRKSKPHDSVRNGDDDFGYRVALSRWSC